MSFDLQWVQDDSKVGRLSLSAGGMSILIQAMSVMELLVEKEPPELTERSSQEEIEEGLAYRASTPGKIPHAKFTSSDGWHLVPEECAVLARGVGDLLGDPFKWRVFSATIHRGGDANQHEKEDRALLQKFVTYCQRCAAVGGFRVL